MNRYIVKSENSNQRLDKIIAKLNNDLSRVTIQRLIEEEKILVNGKKVKQSYKVEINDEITIENE